MSQRQQAEINQLKARVEELKGEVEDLWTYLGSIHESKNEGDAPKKRGRPKKAA